MNPALHSRFSGPWERRDYSPPPSNLAADQDCYVVEVVAWRTLPRIVDPAVSPDEGDAMVREHNGREN